MSNVAKIEQTTMAGKLRTFMECHALSQAQIARSVGTSPSALSQIISGTYAGNVEALNKRLGAYMDNYKHKKADISALAFIKTADVKGVYFTIDEAIIDRELSLIVGASGCGKTTAVKNYCKEHPEAILLEAIPGMTILSALSLICKKLNIQPLRKADEMVLQISDQLRRSDKILIIDEAENLTTATLESIRRIWDLCCVPTVLCGTYALIKNLKGRSGDLQQIENRISGKWFFRSAKESDWQLMFDGMASAIMKITNNLRRAANIYRKAGRLADMQQIKINAGHIKDASKFMYLG